jgi:hypothetical protein
MSQYKYDYLDILRLVATMWETAAVLMKWALIAFALAPVVIAIVWGIVETAILPRLIPKAEIDAHADDMMRRYPDDPEHAAFIEEHAAWFRSKIDEQGRWHRVRKEVRRRLLAGGDQA